jgi:hypothetical protein
MTFVFFGSYLYTLGGRTFGMSRKVLLFLHFLAVPLSFAFALSYYTRFPFIIF